MGTQKNIYDQNNRVHHHSGCLLIVEWEILTKESHSAGILWQIEILMVPKWINPAEDYWLVGNQPSPKSYE